ncbi:MAG: glycosyltransferase [Sulfurimonas sp.]|nr:glycosyltransferase [Sulfurimonas sp.]
MTVYIDITQLERGRANTGIQRVVKEFLKRASISDSIVYKILIFKEETKEAQLLDNNEVEDFLKDIQNYQFKSKEDFDLINLKPSTTTAFFDIDSNWNVTLKRSDLYPILKNNGFLIFNFIYDMIPIILPKYTHENTAINFKLFINAIYKYSDLVMFDSLSAQNDFEQIKDKQNISRDISTRVIGLGCDFLKTNIMPQDKNIKEILGKKYILFVGTIEPRKNQADVLEAFEDIANDYPDLNLVFIGKKGWHVESLIQKILTHSLKDKQLFWLDDIDDATLNQFYQNAFLVTYLSKYEGYGLPIAESLGCGNITITSKNSSMYEVGGNAADYVLYNTLNELQSLITLYCDNENLYKAKKQYIKDNFKTTSWEQFYESILNIFCNFEKSLQFKQNHLSSLQFVFISIDKQNLIGTIKAIDKYMKFVKEYIIVTQPKLIKEFQQIKSTNKITLIDENEILAKHTDGFAKKDHQSKNWLLRASLLNLDILEDEFIMLDDDNRPLKSITIDKFIAKDGSYNAYYFYSLIDWHHFLTPYDLGQENMKNILSDKNYELLSYSSHAPQIINKKIFKEAVDEFFDIGLKTPIDEWSTYFNYAISIYPYSFNKKVYETLSWPATPDDWEYKYTPKEISFENYYKELYDIEFFKTTDTYEQKLEKKKKQLLVNEKSKNIFEKNIDILSKNNMVHTTVKFKTKDVDFFLSNIPYFVVLESDSHIKLKLNYKLLNPSEKNLEISLIIFLDGNYRTLRHLSEVNSSKYQEAIIEMPIFSKNLKEDIYDITFNIMINNKYVYKEVSPYSMKIIVAKDKDLPKVLGNPQLLNCNNDDSSNKSIKNKIKSIPFVGWAIRWSYNLLRLNNLKHSTYSNTKDIKNIAQQLQNYQAQIVMLLEQNNEAYTKALAQHQEIKENEAQIKTLLQHNNIHYENYKQLSDKMRLQINQKTSTQAILFHKKIDKFIDDMKNSTLKPQSLEALKEVNESFIMDDYYLSFEEAFRGSQELILQRYKEYLKYLKPHIKTALDIGCGRGEWTGLLQKNSIDAQGIDLNFAMLNAGTTEGINNLQKMDVFDFFKSCPDNTYDLITAFHFIEHIPFERLFVFLKEIKRIAKPKAQIMLETPNPANILVGAYTFYRDPTHLNPLPAESINFMLGYFGFENMQIEYIHPVDKSQHINENTQAASRINHYFHQAQDYLIIAENSKVSEG